jgi:hypothetical protein
MAATCSSQSGVSPLSNEGSVSCDGYAPKVDEPNVCESTQASSGPYLNNSCLGPSGLTLHYFHDSSKVNASISSPAA